MSMVRWEPFRDMESMFNRMMPRTYRGWPRQTSDGDGGSDLEWAPSADVSETDSEYRIRAELPAVKKEDVKVTVDDGMITIQGERKQEKSEKNEKFHRIESFYGSFERSFALPEDAKVDAIRCESKDGILTVHIPKTPGKKPETKQIKVE